MKKLCKRTMSLLLVLVMLLGMLPFTVFAAEEDTEPDTIAIDFKEVAKEASKQSWWEELATVQTANGYETKRVGNVVRGTAMSETERAAYGELRSWLSDTYGWTINEDASYFDYASGGNRLYLCADDNVAWGVSLNTFYRDYALAIDVTVPEAGSYDLSMVTSKVVKSSQDFPVDGWENTQGGTVDVLVNGELVLDEYNFEGTGTDPVNMGKVQLLAGKNTIVFNSSLNYVGNTNATPCWHFNLCSLTLKPRKQVADGAESIAIDFKQAAKAAAQQDFWNDFETVKTLDGYDTKRVGNIVRGTAMTDAQRAAYGDLRVWLNDTYGWTINEGQSYFDYASGGNRLYLCADDNIGWGFSLNTYYRDYALAIDVDVPAAGRYNMSMVISKAIKGAKDFPVDGWDSTNSGTVDIFVNDELVYDEYSFEGSGIARSELGAVLLKEGKNTIVFNSSTNYVGTTTATPCWHFNLSNVTFTKLDKEKVAEETDREVGLLGIYLPKTAAITPDTTAAESSDEKIIRASITEDGYLHILGIMPGEAVVTVNCDGCDPVEIPVEVTAVDGAERQPIELDFKEFARRAQQQPFWADLATAADENTKYIGKIMNTDTIPASQVAAYEQMIDWGKETFGWTIDEGLSGFTSHWKRLYFNGQDNIPFGMSMYTYYHGSDMPSRSKLAFTVDVPAAGWYEIDLSAFRQNGEWPFHGSTIGYAGSGGDRIAIYVNGQEIYYDYSLVGDNYMAHEDMGAAYFEAGENSLVVDSIFSYNDTGVSGRSNTLLNKMVLTPLEGVTVQEYLSSVLTLNETYFAFDDDVGGLSVESINEMIATATVNASGVVTVSGMTAGTTKLLVKRGDEILCIIPVTVESFGGTLDELQGNVVKVDFMYFADRAAEQEWWAPEGDRMQITSDMEAVTAWLDENTRWNLTDGELTVSGGNYGVAVSDETDLTVNIPAAGLYNVTVEYLAGGGTLDVVDIYSVSTAGEEKTVKASLGCVDFAKGDNTLTLSADGEVYLRSINFTPLGTIQTELGAKQYVNLNETYLAFDEDASSCAASLSGSAASLSTDADGELVVEGKQVGEAVLTLTTDSKTIAVPVKVVELGEVERVIYTADRFKSEVLKVGEISEGDLTGLTVNGTRLAEKYLASYGAVYFTSSDSAVAKVNAKNGDITAVAEGSAIITAYALVDGKTYKDSVTIAVTDDTDLASIDITAAVDYVAVANGLRLKASGLKASGAAADMDKFPVSWEVSDDAIASIDESGLLTGLTEGTVVVTATVGMAKMPITDTLEIKVVDDAELARGIITIQFGEGRNRDIFDWTLERNGAVLVKEETVDGGSKIFFSGAKGIRLAAPQGEGLSIDFVVRKSGWYHTYMDSLQLTSTGGITYAYVDGDFVGVIDSGAANSNDGGGGKMSTVYLEAGVHNVKVIAQENCQVMLNQFIFTPTKDPREVAIDLTAPESMITGQTAELAVEFTDANNMPFNALRTAEDPGHTNYYDITSSNAKVITVSENTITAVGAGEAKLIVSGELAGETVTKEVTVLVTDGDIVRAELSAEETTIKPDHEPIALTLTAYGLDGTALDAIPETAQVTYESSKTEVAAVDANGIVTLTGKEGVSLITATISEEGRTVTADLWITATYGKTAPTVFTYEEREAAQENVLKYDWAWQMKEAAVRKADYYVENLEYIYDMWIPETFPRACQVGFKGDNNYRYCRYCGEDLVSNFHAYPWIVDPIENPWKITCPACKRDFPSNDFGAYYESGLGEDGRFHEELADKSLLTNDLYPEMGEGWGVDDGWGYKAADGSVHTYIAYYLACVFEGLTGNNYMTMIMNALKDAYLYTGDEKYGSAGAILTDRLADIYPEYDVYHYDWSSYAFVEAYSGRGKFIGLTWDGIISKDLSRYVDTFWPAADNPDVVEFIREHGAAFKGMDPEEITPEYLRKNAEDGILLEIFEEAKRGFVQGNFGMSEAGVAYAAHTLNRLPESQEMIDWVFASEQFFGSGDQYVVTGGDVLRTLIDKVSRDGFGNEGSTTYNQLMVGNMIDLADALDGFDLVEGYDLWKNQKFVNMQIGPMRMISMGSMTPAIHEGGFPQQTNLTPSLDYMLTAFIKTGEPELAQGIYAVNGNSTAGIHGDIFTKDPEGGLRSEIQKIVDERGTWDMSDSDMLSGYGIAMLREGPRDYLGRTNAHEFSTYWMGFGYTATSHAQRESLHIDVEAFGLALSSSNGYPAVVASTDPQRMQWDSNTVSHNTVVVNDKGQNLVYEAGTPYHFADDGYAKVIDIDHHKSYEETDIYRRTLVAVDNGDGVHYAVDFFRVLGGSEHVYAFHAMSDTDPQLTGLDMTHQAMGTYAGPEKPYGDDTYMGQNFSNGYTWLYDVYRDAEPSATFTVDWSVKDFRHRLSTTDGIHLKLHMVSDEPMTEVALANGKPPATTNNVSIDHMEYMMVRKSGEVGMDSLFTTVIEPYQHNSYVAKTELVSMELIDGTEGINDRAAAMKVTLTSGRIDYVVYATNADCTYRVDDLFDFRGFTGVVSYTDGGITYAWGCEAATVADVIEGEQSSVTGTVTDFTKGIVLDGYSVTVEMDAPVSAEELTDRYIYVETDGVENGVYRIYGAEVDGNTAVLDLRHQTLVREYVDPFDFDKGYRHNIEEGQNYIIPLSVSMDVGSLFTYTTDKVVKAGTKLTLTTGVAGSGVTYEAEGLPTGAKFSSADGTITWITSRTQTGRYPVTVKALQDGEVLGEMSFVIYVVSYTGSTYDASVCAHSKAVTYTVDGVIETVCPACGTVTKTAVEEEEPAQKFDLVGSNMTLGNELKLNFMANTTDIRDGYVAKITHNGEVTEATFGKYNTSYSYVTYTVAAAQMADTVSVEVFDADGNAVSNVYETSVRAYAMNMLGRNLSAKINTLLVDMLNYGAAAQNAFGYNASDLANSQLTDEQKALATEPVACTDGRVKGNNYYGSNISLESKILLNVFFKNVTEDMYAEITFTAFDGTERTVEVPFEEFKAYSGSVYGVVVDDIALAESFTLVTVTVYNADGTVHGTAADSVESYIARSASSDLNEAIMKFAASAKAYYS